MNARERELIGALGGRWHGAYGVAKCPAHDDRSPSLTIRAGDTAPLLSCKAGCTREAVIAALRVRGLWHSRDGAEAVPWRPPVPKAPQVWWTLDGAPGPTQRACAIWRDAFGTIGVDTPAGRYLTGRGIPPPWPETLAFARLDHPETHERDVPAMIVARHCPTVHQVRGIQRIFLTDDGRKYERGTVKMSLGSIAGGRAELLWPDADLVLAEGVESALSAWRIFRTPAWAMCGGFPSELSLPQRVRTVRVIADHDVRGTSERAGKVLAKSIRAGGRSCTVLMPDDPGLDANDILMERTG